MREVEIGGATFVVGRMTPMDAFHLAQHIGVIGPAYFDLVRQPDIADGDALDDAERDARRRRREANWAMGFIGLPTASADAAMALALARVQVKQPQGYAPLWQSGGLMFTDTPLPTLVQLVREVVEENLGDFFGGMLPPSPGAPAAIST